jgi:hypothetical protein
MSKHDSCKKNYEANNYKQLVCAICDTDFGCNLDREPIHNPVAYAEYVWTKPPVKIEEEKGVMKEKK